VTTSAAVTVTVSNDATPPAVSITAPAAAATLNGKVTVSANASDNVAVIGVQFLVDGVALGPEVTTAPYSISWNTKNYPIGLHNLPARARDAAGNRTTSTVVPVVVH
jgi:hypothetical protein